MTHSPIAKLRLSRASLTPSPRPVAVGSPRPGLGLLCFTLGCLGLLSFTLGAQAVQVDRASGKAQLQKAAAYQSKKIQSVGLSAGAVELTAKFRIDEFFKKTVVNANAQVKNTGEEPAFYHYFVAFFDKDGNLLGAAGQGSYGDEGLAPEQTDQLSGVRFGLDPEQIDQIARYQIILYADVKPLGKPNESSETDDKGKGETDDE